MSRLDVMLVLTAVVCAIGVVSGQHRARQLFVELEREQEVARNLDIEWGQLQLEQSTWAMHARVEKLAANRLQMHPPPPARVQVVPLEIRIAGAQP